MKKSIFLFFAAILCAMSANAAYYLHGSKTGSDWPGKEMTKSADGYYYYQVTSGTHEFKITSTSDWSGTEYTTVLSKYNGTDVAVTGGNGSNCKITNCTSTHYVIIYPKSTLINNTTNYYVCASTTLPNGFGAMHFKHPWNGGSWTYQTATNNGDGTFSYVGKYGSAGVNWCVQKNGTGEKYIGSPTLVGSPVKGDDCTFTFNGADQTITITKKVNKNIGDITITMNCTQQPKIFFWDVEGKTCAAWPGEDMVAAGANTYTYTFEDVDVDLGVDYKINLKAVNENEWATGDLHTTTDVTHDVSNLNIPTIGMHGNFIDGWKDTEKFTISDDYTSATLILDGITEGDHEFGMQIDGVWTSNGKTFTRDANSAEVKSGSGNLKLTADYTGKYTFTYTYKTQTLEVTYPELPTPEYKDITIQVYAKQVPNIWWWNGGDQCLSTEDLVNPSTGNKYKWEEAPAMEKVAGEDNWYTKTFTQVDITKGGIKFKLQSTDHSTSTTNEVVTTEDKCYDARAIATVTETPCGELPSGEIPTVTYNVTVPAETPACYIAGEMTGWSFTPMTKVDDTHYTITIEGAEKTNKYKYTCDEGWDYVEKKADGSNISDRTWTESDVVEKWGAPAPTYDYYIAGTENLTGFNWSANGLGMTKDSELYKAIFTELNAGEYEFKITDGQWNTEEDKTHEWGYSNLGAAYEEVSQGVDGEGNPNGNIKIITEEAKNITVIFDATAGKITFEGLTIVTHTYTIAGDAALCGEAWNWELAANDMTNNGDGTYTWTKAGVEVNGELSFKVFVDHKSDPAYPSENWVIKPENYEGVGVYDVIITFTESSKEVVVALTKQVVTPTPDYIRTGLTVGNYGTICLPYASDNFTGATFFEVVGKEGDKVFFDEVTTLAAGKPYIFLAEATEIKVAQIGEAAIEAGNHNSLQGTFTQIDPAVDNVLKDNYMVVNNSIKKCGINCGLKENRAYFIATELESLGAAPAPAPGVRRITMGVTGQNTATGVDQVQGDNVPTKMIINGQLFILRGEKMYDAQGKLVK